MKPFFSPSTCCHRKLEKNKKQKWEDLGKREKAEDSPVRLSSPSVMYSRPTARSRLRESSSSWSIPLVFGTLSLAWHRPAFILSPRVTVILTTGEVGSDFRGGKHLTSPRERVSAVWAGWWGGGEMGKGTQDHGPWALRAQPLFPYLQHRSVDRNLSHNSDTK